MSAIIFICDRLNARDINDSFSRQVCFDKKQIDRQLYIFFYSRSIECYYLSNCMITSNWMCEETCHLQVIFTMCEELTQCNGYKNYAFLL